MLSSTFWQGKRVLLTGHTGFKGSWLTIWLRQLGAQVTGVSLAPEITPNLFTLASVNSLCTSHFCDIRAETLFTKIIQATEPEIVLHLAAQPLVRASYRKPVETFSTNVMGTAHLLNALRGMESVRVAVMVTTDKVYRNKEWHWPYREEDALGGHDPYSASKAASEIVIASFRDSFLAKQGVAIASARAGNVIGGGDWSEDRLIPDAVRAWQTGQILEIRRPQSIRPWQHVLEPLAGYLSLAEKLWSYPELAGAYNFGPHTVYHEHFSYLSLYTVSRIFEKAGLRVWDVETLPTHGGSLRVFGCHADDARETTPAVTNLLKEEQNRGLQSLEVYQTFQAKADKVKDDLLIFLVEQKRAGKKVAAYGAAAKGNTLLNYAGVKPDLLTFVCDAAAAKQGKFMPGSHIPILSPDAIQQSRPDYVVILPWNIAYEVMKQNDFIREWGGQFVTAVPELIVR